MIRRHPIVFAAVLVSFLILVPFLFSWFGSGDKSGQGHEPSARPNEWFWAQRAWPGVEISPEAWQRAQDQARHKEIAERGTRTDWVAAGPDNIGARVTDLAVHPTDPHLVYAAMASGGIFKSVDGGDSWTPIFDQQAALPVGAVALDPQQPETIYAGTGEANAASLSFFGQGVFRSDDGGGNWESLGLEETRYIARIAVDPTNSNRVFLAATGKLFGTNPERGVYRSLDRGESWNLVHSVTDSTACIDLAINPLNPEIIYAAMWERIRGLTYRRSGGDSSGIWRSVDGGDSWHELTSGLPGGSNVGRIGITLCASEPDVLYAIYADSYSYFEGVYKSTDGGDSWSGVNDGTLGGMYSSYGWWFGNIRVDPTNPNRVITLGLYAYMSINGGGSWSSMGSNMHVDHHALVFAPSLPSRVYEGNDGGIYRSTNSGGTWSKLYDQPTSQFYAIGIDELNPHRLYGGTQDCGTLRTWDGGTSDWENILGGDGFYTIVDYTDSDVIYAEYQRGGLMKTTNGGYTWGSATSGISGRNNWSTPVVMDPVDHNTLYYGTHLLFRTTNGASYWSAISGDLTGGDHGGNFGYGTITTIAVSPVDTDLIVVGSDDSHVWITADGGGEWTFVSGDLPERWVTRVACDPNDADIIYACFSGLRWEDDRAHVFRSLNRGADWEDIATDLPAAPVNVILADPAHPGVLYVGTDVGCYYTTQPGGTWQVLGSGLPNSPVLDLKLHQGTRKLVAGTHGRSMFTLDLGTLTATPAVPVEPLLLTASPNPFNPVTRITYTQTVDGPARMTLHDIRGRQLAILLDRHQTAGEHQLIWRGEDHAGRELASGVYFVRFSDGRSTRNLKLTLIR